jgi:hypothetical protein
MRSTQKRFKNGAHFPGGVDAGQGSESATLGLEGLDDDRAVVAEVVQNRHQACCVDHAGRQWQIALAIELFVGSAARRGVVGVDVDDARAAAGVGQEPARVVRRAARRVGVEEVEDDAGAVTDGVGKGDRLIEPVDERMTPVVAQVLGADEL